MLLARLLKNGRSSCETELRARGDASVRALRWACRAEATDEPAVLAVLVRAGRTAAAASAATAMIAARPAG
jgi:hypothetical protein